MYYVTAERNVDAIFHRKPFYSMLERHGFHCDIRNMKAKDVKCPNKECKLSKTGFSLPVQEQVDVAIVMTAMALAWKRELASLTLIAGDGDFRDCIEFITKTAQKRVSICAYKNSCNQLLKDVATKCFYLDEIWEKISEPIPPEQLGKEEENQVKQQKKNGQRQNLASNQSYQNDVYN